MEWWKADMGLQVQAFYLFILNRPFPCPSLIKIDTLSCLDTVALESGAGDFTEGL